MHNLLANIMNNKEASIYLECWPVFLQSSYLIWNLLFNSLLQTFKMRNIIRTSHDQRRRSSSVGIDLASIPRRDSMPQLQHQLSFSPREGTPPPRTPPVDRLYRQHTEVHLLSGMDSSTRKRLFASNRSATATSPLIKSTGILDEDENDSQQTFNSTALATRRQRRAMFARRASRSRVSEDTIDACDSPGISYTSLGVVLMIVVGCFLMVLLLAYFIKRPPQNWSFSLTLLLLYVRLVIYTSAWPILVSIQTIYIEKQIVEPKL